MKTHLIAAVVLAIALGGCTTTFQYSGTTKTDQTLVYTASVGGTDVRNATVTTATPLPVTVVGKFKRGSVAAVDVTLPRGGRISHTFQTLSADPNPVTINVDTASIQGTYVDIGTEADIEKSITDVEGSYMSPTPLVDNLLQANLGGVYLVTDNPKDTANPSTVQIYGPSDLGSTAPASFYEVGQFPGSLTIALVLDQSSAGKVGTEIKTLADLNADYSTSDIYKYSLSLQNTGWRRSPVTWAAVSSALAGSDDGKAKLANIQQHIQALKPGQHIYYMDRAFIIGALSINLYQAQRLSADADVKAGDYLALNAAYTISTASSNSKDAQNTVLRVNYEDLQLFNAPAAATVHTQLLNSAAVRSSLVHLAALEKPAESTDLKIIAVPVNRGKRF